MSSIQPSPPSLKSNKSSKNKPAKINKGGAPKGNRNAAKQGEDLRFEMFLSKTRRGFFEEWFELKYGKRPTSEDQLREAARQIANAAIDRAMVEEFERHEPGRTLRSKGETF